MQVQPYPDTIPQSNLKIGASGSDKRWWYSALWLCGDTVHYKYSIANKLTCTSHCKYSIANKLTCTSSMCLIFALLDCLFSKEIHQQNKECKHHMVKNNFYLQNLLNSAMSKWDIHTPVHCILNWCQLHHYHISYTMSKQETIHLTTFSTHNWKKLLLNLSLFEVKMFPVGCDLSCPLMHCY